MPRPSRKLPPNAGVDFVNGPLAPMPGVRYLINQPARLVKTSQWQEQNAPGLFPLWYLTVTGQRPSGPLYAVAAGVRSYNYGWADQLALTTGGPITHYVWRVEVWDVNIIPNYARIWIAQLPF
jgi:hypothetical protein